jgi:MULE transposase domain
MARQAGIERSINPKQVSNIMTQTRSDGIAHTAEHGGDIAMLVNRLAECKREDPGWEYDLQLDLDGRIDRIWWMNPYQHTLARFHRDVIVLDTCEGRNLWDFHPTTFIVIDGNYCSRNIAYGLTAHQNADTFKFLFNSVRNALNLLSGPLKLIAIFSDRHDAIAFAIQMVWPGLFHGHCLWHLYKNLMEKLQKLLHPDYLIFKAEFTEVCNMGSPASFEIAWARLLQKFPEATAYLTTHIYPDRKKWAWAWVGTRFVAGLRTSGRAECEHRVYKLMGLNRGYGKPCAVVWFSLSNNRTTFNVIFTKLNDRSEQQADEDLRAQHQVPHLIKQLLTL